MYNSNINLRNYISSPPKSPQNTFQWKKANQNLQNYIESQNLAKNQFFLQNNYQFDKYPNKEKIQHQNKIDYLKLDRQRSFRYGALDSPRSQHYSPNILSRYGSVERIKTKRQVLSCSIGIQVSEDDNLSKRKCLIDQNKCLKELINVLQNQILDYSRKISQKEQTIFQLNSQYDMINQEISKQTQEINVSKEKLKKQSQMNYYLEYIISQLNQKVSSLLNQNQQLKLKFQKQNKFNSKSDQNTQTFSQNQSLLSVNSATFKKQQYTTLQKNTDSIIEELQSKILPDEQENWSCTGLQMSFFNKTPVKVHQISICQELDRTPKQINQSKYDENIQEILFKHKKELTNLKQKVKYYEIQNSMLKRKKQLFQKNSEQISELKRQIQKLTEQNKVIKLIHNKKKKQPTDKQGQYKQERNRTDNKKFGNQSIVNKKNIVQDESKNQVKLKAQSTNSLTDAMKQNQLNACKQMQNSKRKGLLQRKFIRKQNHNIRSPSRTQQDSDVSFSLSPQRMQKQKHKR